MFGIIENKLVENTQFIIDSIGEGLLIVDREGIITHCNQAAAELLSVESVTLIGQFCLRPFGALDEFGKPITKSNAALFHAIRHGKRTVNATRQFLRKDGSHFWASITVSPMVKKDKTEGAVIVFRDVTEDRLDREYHRDFARVASHQLRTPLGNVLWSIEFLLSKKPGKLTDIQEDTLSGAYTVLKELNALVNDLLSVSQLQGEKIKVHPKPIVIEDTVQRVVQDLSHIALASNLNLSVESDKKKGHRITIDKHHLRTIIQNIVENAIRYSRAGTTIEIHIETHQGKTLFRCSNKGIGIPKSSQKFIFAKFYRAKNAVKKQGDGTGLGMYITHELVQLAGGKIWFESIPRKTTTFYVLFNS